MADNKIKRVSNISYSNYMDQKESEKNETKQKQDPLINPQFERTYNLSDKKITGDSEYNREQVQESVDSAQGTNQLMNAGGSTNTLIDNIHVIYQDNTVANFSIDTVIADNGDRALDDRNWGIKFTVGTGTATMTKATTNATVADTAVYDDVYFYLPILIENVGVVCNGGVYKEGMVAINGDLRATLFKIS